MFLHLLIPSWSHATSFPEMIEKIFCSDFTDRLENKKADEDKRMKRDQLGREEYIKK